MTNRKYVKLLNIIDEKLKSCKNYKYVYEDCETCIHCGKLDYMCFFAIDLLNAILSELKGD